MSAPAPLVCSFDRLEAATGARDALLGAGFAPAAVQLSVIADEAGPVEGNFLVGNGRRDNGAEATGQPGDAPVYGKNFSRSISRGVHLLVVEAADDEQRRLAGSVLDQHGATDVEGGSTRAGR